MRSNCPNRGKGGKKTWGEVRIIININRFILTSPTSLTPFYALACKGKNLSMYGKNFLFATKMCRTFRGKWGKKVRVSFLLPIFLLPLLQIRGKGREVGGKK